MWRIFVETLPADSDQECLKPYNFQRKPGLYPETGGAKSGVVLISVGDDELFDK